VEGGGVRTFLLALIAVMSLNMAARLCFMARGKGYFVTLGVMAMSTAADVAFLCWAVSLL
jgi:hypothetical protein